MVWEIYIPVIAAGLSLIGIVLELLMHDREKAKEIEFSMKRKQREVKKFQKEKDTKAMMDAQKELMSLMGKNMRLRMKTMFVSFPLFIIIFFFLKDAMIIAPLIAGQPAELGVDLRNLDDLTQTINVELIAEDMQITEPSQDLELAAYAMQGDRKQVWWAVTSASGSRPYTIKISSGNDSEEVSATAVFVTEGSLTAGFSASTEPSKELGGSLEVLPVFRAVTIDIFGMDLDWYVYYIISFFIIAVAISPLKNQILWGHHKGIKHLEKLDSQKSH
jgi:hypothetical protein